MIIGCMNVYQDAALLGMSIPALKERVDRLVVVDGAYRDFRAYGDSPSSMDGTQALARWFGAEVLVAQAGLDEPAKRSRYFVGKPGDWYVVVDSDEVIEGATREELKAALEIAGREADDFAIPFCDAHVPWEARTRTVFRLHKHRDGMCYQGTHHALHVPDASGKLCMPVKPHKAPRFNGLLLRHFHAGRSAERGERKVEFYKKQKAAEHEFRARHGL